MPALSVLRLNTHILLNSVHTFYSVTCNSIRSMRRTIGWLEIPFDGKDDDKKLAIYFLQYTLALSKASLLNWTQILEISGLSSVHTTGQCPASANLQKPSLFRVAKTCGPCGPVGAIFFWPVLIFGKSTQKTGENTRQNRRKQAKNRRFFGANFLGGEIGRC